MEDSRARMEDSRARTEDSRARTEDRVVVVTISQRSRAQRVVRSATQRTKNPIQTIFQRRRRVRATFRAVPGMVSQTVVAAGATAMASSSQMIPTFRMGRRLPTWF